MKIIKTLFIFLCIFILLIPFYVEATGVSPLTKDSTEADIESIGARNQGFSYKVGDHDVLKIVQHDDSSFSDVLYCVNAEKSLSVADKDGYHFRKVASDFTNYNDKEVKEWTQTLNMSQETHGKLVCLLEHLYLLNHKEYKKKFLEEVFADYIKEHQEEEPTPNVDEISSKLTDDYIDVVQQWAIWYFTNSAEINGGSTDTSHKTIYNTFSSVSVEKPNFGVLGSVGSTKENINGIELTYMQELYKYLINCGKGTKSQEVRLMAVDNQYPKIDRTKDVSSTIDGDSYKIGPFKVSGTTVPVNFKLSLVDQDGHELTNYTIVVNDSSEENKELNQEILGKEFYVKIPTTGNTITSIKLKMTYSTEGEKNISLWEKTDEETQDLQPVILILDEPGKEVSDEIEGKVTEGKYDLALRKYIVSINKQSTTGREPTPTQESLEKLASGDVTTADYNHAKNPLLVKKGDKIVYEFRIYNEGEVQAKVKKIIDYLPEGLTVVESRLSEVNQRYEWETTDDGLTTTYLSDKPIAAFDKQNKNLTCETVQLECEVTGELETGKILTNVAEVEEDDGTDRDSTESSIEKSEITDDFCGDSSNNKDNLGDSNHYYKGKQDDDDFEKLIVKKDLFDLNLKKFISKVNGRGISREPKVDLTPLINGGNDAKYTTSKNPLLVETGDVVTFTLRVYNEGDIAGYAEQITDYIPEGLGFLVNYNDNEKCKWQVSEDSSSSNKKKLSDIRNGTKHLTVEDFSEVTDLDDVEVVLGKTKVTTDMLASSDDNETNLISAFTGTTMTYKDVEITCIVVAEDTKTLKNISAITAEKDKDKTEVKTDRGSDKVDSSPNDDIDPDKYTTGNEDDDDYDVLKTDKRNFDLALQKFITGVNSEKITNRVPEVSKDEDGNLHYNHPLEPVEVCGGDLIEYTIRVYNEGEMNGYAKEISDSIPTGLVFVSENETNVEYDWKMYDSDGNETDNESDAVEVRTTYLSKEKSDDNLIEAFDKDAEVDDENPSYKDVKLVLKLDDTLIKDKTSKILINVAEITENTDENGDDILDSDSTPDNENPTEDDIDEEKVTYLEYDLALRKFIVSVNGKNVTGREPKFTDESLQSLANKTSKTLEYRHVKSPIHVEKGDKIVYEFRIYNEGDSKAIVKKIVDYLPEGLTLVDNSDINSEYKWNFVDGNLTTSYLESTEIPAFNKNELKVSYGQIKLECEVTGDFSSGTVLTNVAEIIEDNGNDRDSQEGSINKENINEDFSGNVSNDDDLGKENYYYKGLQDDDDFEKLVIDGKIFDLNLKKFISKVNNESLSREPKVDTSTLKNGANDAKYEMTKTPIEVETGDIVTFTLRVYNEGEVSGYAEQITDYIPEGLGFLEGYKTNYDNYWSISQNEKNSVKLSTIKDGMKNVKLEDFKDVDNLENVEVILGKTKVTSKALSSELTDSNLISSFNGKDLKYKDVQIACIVVAEDEITLKNIAAITAEKDENKNPVDKDRDSTPKDDINPDDYGTGNEDDDDYDIVKTEKKDFDLALQKFITGINGNEVQNRAPVIVKGQDGKLKYNHPTDAVKIHNGDLVKYTIRVYNEGEIDGYADEIGDNIPTGLVFVPDNETNVKYGWKMYDKSGNETGDANQAVSVKTNYLSKPKSENNLIPAFNKDAGVSDTNPSYKDVELVFRIDETLINKTVTTSERTLINIAEITKTTDKDGKDIPDIDSTPNNGNPNEDDIDKEQVYVEYFDLALEKDLAKALVTVDGKTTELNVAKGEAIKVDVNRKKLSTTTIKFVYNIVVRNEGEIEGYATEITDYIPEGLSFDPADNPGWNQISERVISTNTLAKTLLQPGQSTTVSVVLTWVRSEQNMGEFMNIAEITEHWNPYGSPDIDSTPNNQVPTEDDYDNAPVYVGIVTGLGERPYILLTGTVLLVIGVGIVLIKKYVL